MESRQEQLSQLRDFIKEAEKEVTMILQTLQWDKDCLLKAESMVTCKFDTNHRIPLKKQKEHEDKCYLKSQEYKSFDVYLPEPLEANAKTVVTFTSDEIKQIIDVASKNDPLFKKGNASVEAQPLTLDRIATTYTTDERRAIHDAVVNTMPSFHDLSDLALPSSSSDASASKQKSRLQVLAELRDMRRRRARYRGAAPAKNYSHTLRDLIASQMELYTGSNVDIKLIDQKTNRSDNNRQRHEDVRRDINTYTKGTVRENIKHREHFGLNHKDKLSYKDGRYAEDKSDRQRSSHSKEREGRFSRYDDRKRWDKYHDSQVHDRNYSSKDRPRRSDDRHRQHRDRKEEAYRREEKNEHRRYYDYDNRYEKLGRNTSNGKSRHKENR